MFHNRTFGDFQHKRKNVSCFLPGGKAQDTPSPALPRVRSRKPTASPLVALDLGHPGLLQRQGKITASLKMKTRFSIKTKIFLVILTPSLLLFLVIYLDYRNLSALGRSAELILSKNYKSIQAAQQIRQLIEADRNTILGDIFLGQKISPKKLQLQSDILNFLNVCKDNITEEP